MSFGNDINWDTFGEELTNLNLNKSSSSLSRDVLMNRLSNYYSRHYPNDPDNQLRLDQGWLFLGYTISIYLPEIKQTGFLGNQIVDGLESLFEHFEFKSNLPSSIVNKSFNHLFFETPSLVNKYLETQGSKGLRIEKKENDLGLDMVVFYAKNNHLQLRKNS